MITATLYDTWKRYRTLRTDTITSMPVAIIMPHSACNCRCAMCDIWKGNRNLQQLTEKDFESLLFSLHSLGTKRVVMSGGEALLNPGFFDFCSILASQKIKITLLSTGITLEKHAPKIVEMVDDVIVSLDGDEQLHDRVRNITGAYQKMKNGIRAIHNLDKDYRITGRSVIHRINYRHWPDIVESARQLGLKQVSFLPADVTSAAFNRADPWDRDRQNEIAIPKYELRILETVAEHIIAHYSNDLGIFIAENEGKIRDISKYYSALHGLNPFPYKKCNAPWVSTVVEADGTVRPCFFHQSMGNMRSGSLHDIINSEHAKSFRKHLDVNSDPTCQKCVCHLNLSPHTKL